VVEGYENCDDQLMEGCKPGCISGANLGWICTAGTEPSECIEGDYIPVIPPPPPAPVVTPAVSSGEVEEEEKKEPEYNCPSESLGFCV